MLGLSEWAARTCADGMGERERVEMCEGKMLFRVERSWMRGRERT